MTKMNCLLFDLDGTLLDSRDAVVDAVYHIAEKYVPGMFAREDLLKRFGESLDDFLEVMEQSLEDKTTTKEHILETYFAYIHAHHDEKVRLFPEVEKGLKALKSVGYSLGIVTNKQREFTVRGLKIAGIFHLFDSIVTLDDVEEGKPSPEMLIKAMWEIGASADASLMVGDSKYDLLAANAAKVPFAALEWYGPEDWHDPAPQYRFADFQELVQELLAVKSK